jgi:hypothetical protein
MAKLLVEFLPDRAVPDATVCNENRDGRCATPAMMLVRVEGREHFFCYHHLSLLYNREIHPQRRNRQPPLRGPHRRVEEVANEKSR